MSETTASAREDNALAFISGYTAFHGYPPTTREVGSHVGLRSSSDAHRLLERMAQRGLIRRTPSVPRSVVILDRGEGEQP